MKGGYRGALFNDDENVAELDFNAINGLKLEARRRLAEIRPQTPGQAGRIPGIPPADLAVLAVWLEKSRRERAG